MNIDTLLQVSWKYGRNSEFVLGGGGNTSWKSGDTMFVKASGTSLATIDESGFVSIRLDAARNILAREYSQEASKREGEVLAALMDSRTPGQTRRPSVETILHALFPFAFVVHTHPCVVNGLLCSMESEKVAKEIFGEGPLWLPYTTPGYILSRKIFDIFSESRAREREIPKIVFLQNHGIFVGGDTPEEIDSLYSMVMSKIESRLMRRPDKTPVNVDQASVDMYRAAISSLPETASVLFAADAEIVGRVSSAANFAPLVRPFSPDHIVYAGARSLFVRAVSKPGEIARSVESAWENFNAENGIQPKIVAVEGLGIFARGDSEKNASLAMELFLDAIGVARYSESFGGPHHMDKKDEDFIKTWEVEQYRSKVMK
jgi:rhamnose utilization protein RhaD (predicted bifunctional aldolase and dehydrogenase)